MGWFWFIVMICAIIILRKNLKKIFTNSDDVAISISQPNRKESYDLDEEDPYNQHPDPILFDKRQTITLDGDRYFIAWMGQLPETTFSVNRKEKVTIRPTHILVKNEEPFVAQIQGDSHLIYSKDSISSQLKTEGKGSKPFYDWIRTFNDFPWNFEWLYKEKESYIKDYEELWSGKSEAVTFTYPFESRQERKSVIPLKLLKGKSTGDIDLLVKDEKGKKHIVITSSINGYIETQSQGKIPFSIWADEYLLGKKSVDNQEGEIIWEGECAPTTFTYRDWENRERITVKPTQLIKKPNGYFDLIAIDEHGKTKTYFKQYIETMLATEGFKKKHFEQWVDEVLLIKEPIT